MCAMKLHRKDGVRIEDLPFHAHLELRIPEASEQTWLLPRFSHPVRLLMQQSSIPHLRQMLLPCLLQQQRIILLLPSLGTLVTLSLQIEPRERLARGATRRYLPRRHTSRYIPRLRQLRKNPPNYNHPYQPNPIPLANYLKLLKR
ncbi:hypothetical protein ABW20_dc0103132 [Dactylellina cionopaga]|nr:hypothetical protein ABW20_dc0103132 [Dactylellina cionopaga]